MPNQKSSAFAHESLVAGQFGPRASAYVTSAVHAGGADLDRMADMAASRKGSRIADLGCGGGHVSFAVAPHASEVVACDLSADMLLAVAAEAARRGLSSIATQQVSVLDLPFADGSFDMVMSRYSAHHWTDVRQGLREARRIARRGAVAAFADVIAPAFPLFDTFLQSIELLRDPSHVRNMSLSEWCASLADAGFAPTAMRSARLRLDFASWIARIGTPAVHAEAIRSLQRGAPDAVQRHFAIEADGSFTLDTVLLEAVAQ